VNTFSNAIRWQDTLVTENGSVRDAITSLNHTGLQIVLVVSPDKKFLGTITDGDIRRAILDGITLTQSLNTVLNKNPIIANPELTSQLARKQMQQSGISHLPIVDSLRNILGIHFLNEKNVMKVLENTFVVMAGGKGTRLLPRTETCPKPMLNVGDKPILHHILNRARSQGFKNFVFAIHYLGDVIEDYFGSGTEFGVNIKYIRETNPLGTAGALRLLNLNSKLPILVTNGDLLTDISYDEMLNFHIEHEASATLAVRMYEWQNPFGVVETHGVEVVRFEEKPIFRSQTNAGVYVFEQQSLNLLTRDIHIDMPDFLEKIRATHGRVVAYGVHENWLDIGRPGDFNQAQELNSRIGFSPDTGNET
jgi:dTDP-glucose pyrophosphorylase/predicted transcriptional regulator